MGTCGTRGPARYSAALAPGCREAEQRLLKSLLPNADVFDTAVDLASPRCQVSIHSIEVNFDGNSAASAVPVVCLPGYGTGGAIFASCWKYMLERIFEPHGPLERRRLIAIDPLGMFLSSRPPWTPGVDVTEAESWFADSLEAWCKARGLQEIDLLGHSIGGNIAAAFAERYPQRIRRLILLSPAGLCPEPKGYREKLRNAPWRIRLLFRFWRRGSSPMMLVRCLPRKRGRQLCSRIVTRWVGKAASTMDSDTVAALADYIFHGWTEGRESAGCVLGALLHPGAWGKKPLAGRLPELKIGQLEMIYGESDWMDVRHGNEVANATSQNIDRKHPTVVVQLIDAGHYAHVQAVPAFCQALLNALSDRNAASTWSTPAPIPDGYAERFMNTPEKRVPKWRSWEGYDFGH